MDDVKMAKLLEFVTFSGSDVCAAWVGRYYPATRSDDSDLVSMARFNRDHYVFYRYFVEKHMEKRGDVLDIGSGAGHRANMLTRYSRSVIGIERDVLLLSFAAKFNSGGVAYYQGSFPECSQGLGRKFDYIFAVEVLEHIPHESQQDFVSAGVEILNPGGKMFLTVPNDKEIQRDSAGRPIHPHVGLWTLEEYAGFLSNNSAHVLASGLLDVGAIDNTDSPEADSEPASHHYIVLGNAS